MKDKYFIAFIHTQLKTILKVWMATETFLSKVYINRKKGCRKKATTNERKKSDKSHEQSHFSPHIIQKKKRQCIVSSCYKDCHFFS